MLFFCSCPWIGTEHSWAHAWQVMRLKERLEVTEEELARVRSAAGSHAVSGDGGDTMGRVVYNRSPSSSFSTGTCQQPSLLENLSSVPIGNSRFVPVF